MLIKEEDPTPVTIPTNSPTGQASQFNYNRDAYRTVENVPQIRPRSLLSTTCKSIPLQALTGTEGSRRLRLPDFKTIGT
jgi:hypothetical protein